MSIEDTLTLEQTAATHKANTSLAVHGWFETATSINDDTLPYAVNLLVAAEQLRRLRDPRQIISAADEINTTLERISSTSYNHS